jgi:nucleoside-diphosphate-sugar epimerase
MKPKKIVLIGGAGFIGHNLSLALKKRGHEPIIIDSLGVNNLLSFANSDSNNRNLYWSILNQRIEKLHSENIQINIEDARDYNTLCSILHQINPDVVIQLAAVSHATKSNKDPHSTFDHSLRTLENALDFSKSGQTNVNHFIYFSSSMVYGHFDSKEVTEETPCNPLGIYGTLKYSGELITKAYHRVFDLPYTIIRPSALYGERCVSRRVGQIFIENAVQGLDINVSGDGSNKLDFTYIDDLVNGIIQVVENKKAKNETFNLTYGKGRTIGEMAEIIKDHFKGININYTPKDNLTPDRGTLNIDKAKKIINYNPMNSLEIGYPKYINWYKKCWDSLKKE